MRVSIINIPATSVVRGLPTLVIEPESNQAIVPVLLFLHGKGEASSSPNELPKVCVHQTPPFQAMLSRLPGALVIAPQAPPLPSTDDWNWREYVKDLAKFLTDRFANRRVVASGFSRGGLGVLQMASAYPNLVQAWAVVDPQPARDQSETDVLIASPEMLARGWLRYGLYRNRNDNWKAFSSLLTAKLPDENRDNTELEHGDMALQAYSGSPLSTDVRKKNLYDFLGLEFGAAHAD
jgi:pimeloyl-ACP methyl ester carboxylesterase